MLSFPDNCPLCDDNDTPCSCGGNNPDLEIWAEDTEGAFRVSEIGDVPVPKTIQEAMQSKWWPMYSKMQWKKKSKGKLANKAWTVVRRPTDAKVLKSRWVYTIKYNDDGSIRVVKARFVACGLLASRRV